MLRSIPDWMLHSKQPHARVELRNVKNLLLQMSLSVHQMVLEQCRWQVPFIIGNSFLHTRCARKVMRLIFF